MDTPNSKPIFINFTAKWCLTCKVNKKLVLQSNDFKELVKDTDLQLMEGDWTKRDDSITKFLKSYNIVGVPAYFIKLPSGKIISLGETISLSKIKKNL
jgi:thiol:disulfide interchange protein DsbD